MPTPLPQSTDRLGAAAARHLLVQINKTYHYGCMARKGHDIALDPERLKWTCMRGYVKS
jgi:hypothetical protein